MSLLYLLVLTLLLREVKSKETDYILVWPHAVGYVNLYAFTASSPGYIHVWSPSDNATFDYNLLPFGHNLYALPSYLTLSKGIESKSVIVSVDDETNVQLRGKSWRGVYTTVPIYALGERYIIASCFAKSNRPTGVDSGTLVVATHAYSASVRISFKTSGNVTYNGKTYFDGDDLNVTLNSYETLILESIAHDITGTEVESDSPVAVFTGTRTYSNSNALEQLLPVSNFGQEFAFAVGGINSKDYVGEEYHLTVLTLDPDTKLSFNDGSEVTLNKDAHFQRTLATKDVVVFSSTRPVQSTLCRQMELTLIPPTSILPNYVVTYNDYHMETMIFSKTPDDVAVTDQTFGNPNLIWTDINGTNFKFATIAHSQLLLFESDSPFALISYTWWTNFNGGYNLTGIDIANPAVTSPTKNVSD